MKQWSSSEPCLVIQGNLLEGPLYDEDRDECRFIDIKENKLYTFVPSKGQESLKEVTTEETLGVTANIKGTSSKYIVGAKSGYATVDVNSGKISYIKKMWDAAIDGPMKESYMRCNDGAIDSHGRYWIGGMHDPLKQSEEGPEGSGILFRLDPDLSLHRMLYHASAPNGIGWNSANTIMYWTDSEPSQNIYSFDFDVETGSISPTSKEERRVFWNSSAAGYGKDEFGDDVNPDGLVVDAEDCVWSALWRGFKCVRISPAGQVIGEVVLPTAYVTCPVFAGTELILTTARDPRVKEEGKKRGGDVYKVDVGIRGESRSRNQFLLTET